MFDVNVQRFYATLNINNATYKDNKTRMCRPQLLKLDT